MAEQRRLLIAGRRHQRQATPLAARLGARQQSRQRRHRHAEQLAQQRIPVAGFQIVEQGAAGLARLGRRLAGQPLRQEGVEGAGNQLAAGGAPPAVGQLVEQPRQLRRRIVGRQMETGASRHVVGVDGQRRHSAGLADDPARTGPGSRGGRCRAPTRGRWSVGRSGRWPPAAGPGSPPRGRPRRRRRAPRGRARRVIRWPQRATGREDVARRRLASSTRAALVPVEPWSTTAINGPAGPREWSWDTPPGYRGLGPSAALTRGRVR